MAIPNAKVLFFSFCVKQACCQINQHLTTTLGMSTHIYICNLINYLKMFHCFPLPLFVIPVEHMAEIKGKD
jgi:hypothetical protein